MATHPAPRFLALAALASALAAPLRAGAHDCVVACASQPGHVEVQLDSAYGAISRSEGAGDLARLSLQGSVAVGGGVTLSALVPTYTVYFDRLRRSGLGDVSLAASRGVARGDGSFYLAVAGHLPTGDAAQGLGAGHAMVMLGAGATWAPPGRLRLGVRALDALAPLVSTTHVHTVNLVAPHAMHEAFYEAWGSWRAGAAVLRAGVAAQTSLSSGDAFRTAVTPTFAVAVGLAPGWSTSATLVAPAAGQGWFGWGTSLAVTRTFGGPGCEGVVP